MDVSTVHTLIGNLVMGSYTTYAKIQKIMNHINVRTDCTAFKYHYEGADIHTKEISRTMDILDNMN